MITARNITIRLAALILLLSAASITNAQKYEPNTRWPYIYENFMPGRIEYPANTKSEGFLNIHYYGNKLHFVSQDGKILEPDDTRFNSVTIANDTYVYADGKLMKVIASEGKNQLLLLQKADFDALHSGSGAYGASLNSSATMNLTSLDLGGLDKPELAKMQTERNDGRPLDVTDEYWYLIDGKAFKANKKEVLKNVSDVKATEAFIKDIKIKWKSQQSLYQLLLYLSGK